MNKNFQYVHYLQKIPSWRRGIFIEVYKGSYEIGYIKLSIYHHTPTLPPPTQRASTPAHPAKHWLQLTLPTRGGVHGIYESRTRSMMLVR
jgi:hypothetical protein